MKLPNKIFGIDTKEAYNKYLKGSSKKPKPSPKNPLNVSAPNLEGYIHIPKINLYVSKEKTIHGNNWYKTHKELHKQNQRMLTIPEFTEFLKYLKQNPNQENNQILDEILAVRDPWRSRSEWLDAYFEKRKNGFYILTNKKTKAEKLETCLMSNRTPGIDLEYWLNNSTKQGLPKKDTPNGNLWYWKPENNYVARFNASSVRVFFSCDRNPEDSYSSLRVRPALEKI